jgi:hypothetical protein
VPLSSERVENKPLTGPEIKDLCAHLLRKALDAEWAFHPGTSYPRVGLELTAKFHFLSVSMPKVEPRVRIEAPLESAPLRDVPEGSDEGVIALKIEKTVENPNLERVHAGIPITVTSKTGAAPGQMFPRVEHHQVTYDPSEYPVPEPPTQTDLSAETAKEWNVKVAEPPVEEITMTLPEAEEVISQPKQRTNAMGLKRKPGRPKVVREEAIAE